MAALGDQWDKWDGLSRAARRFSEGASGVLGFATPSKLFKAADQAELRAKAIGPSGQMAESLKFKAEHFSAGEKMLAAKSFDKDLGSKYLALSDSTRGLDSKLDRLVDPMRGFTSKLDEMDRFFARMDPTNGLDGRILDDLAKMDRLMDPMRALDRKLHTSVGTYEPQVLLAPPPAITIISNRAPTRLVRCPVCKGPAAANFLPNGILEVFSPCECGALVGRIRQDLEGGSSVAPRPLLHVLTGGRHAGAGPAVPTGQLKIVDSRPSKPPRD